MGEYRPVSWEFAGSKSGRTPALSDWLPWVADSIDLNSRTAANNVAVCAGCLVVLSSEDASWTRPIAADLTTGGSPSYPRLRVCAEVCDVNGQPFNNGYLPAATAGRIRTWELEDALFRIREDGDGGLMASTVTCCSVATTTIDNYSLGQHERLTPRALDMLDSSTCSATLGTYAIRLVKKDPDPRCATTYPVWITMIDPLWYNGA